MIISNTNKHIDDGLRGLNNSIEKILNSNTQELSGNLSQQISASANAMQCNCMDQKTHDALENCDTCYDKYFAFYLQSAFHHAQPFDRLLPYLQVTQDDYLNEISKSGVATTQELQKEFIFKILPLIESTNAIKIENNLLAKWIQLRSYDQNIEKQLVLLTQQVSTQDFNNAIQTIATLPEEIQKILREWHEKVKAYVYAKESLKVYLEQHG